MSIEFEIPDDWDEEQAELYGRLARWLGANMDGFLPPKMARPTPEQWDTLGHNLAYAAVELLRCEDLTIRDTATEQVVASTPPRLSS